jgi:hypothetical protein
MWSGVRLYREDMAAFKKYFKKRFTVDFDEVFQTEDRY